MSQINLDNLISLLPTEQIPADPLRIYAGSDRKESFDDHLQRAQTRSGDASDGGTDSAAAEIDRHLAAEPPAAADESEGDPPAAADDDVEESAAEQIGAEDAVEDERGEATPAEDNAENGQDANSAEDGQQSGEETQIEGADAGRKNAEQTLSEDEDVGQVGPEVEIGPTLQDGSAGQKTAGQKTAESTVPDAAAAGQEIEDAAAGRRAISSREVKAADPNGQPAAAEAVIEEPLSEESGRRQDSSAGSNDNHPEQAAAGQSAATGKMPAEVPAQTDRPVNESAAAIPLGQPSEPRTADADAPPRSGDRSAKTNSTSGQKEEVILQPPKQNSAAVPPAVEVQSATPSAEQTASATESPAETSQSGPKTALTGAAESQPEAAVRASANLRPRASTPAQSPQPAEPGGVDRVRFVQRVAGAFRALGGDGSVRLRLSPPELGSLRLEISVRNGQMTARLETENSTVRNLLLDNLPALRDRLAQQEIKIEQFNVELTDRSPGGLPDRTADHAQPRDRRAGHDAAEASGNGDEDSRPPADPGAVRRPGEGSQLNVVV